jgi:hypothetical protein
MRIRSNPSKYICKFQIYTYGLYLNFHNDTIPDKPKHISESNLLNQFITRTGRPTQQSMHRKRDTTLSHNLRTTQRWGKTLV